MILPDKTTGSTTCSSFRSSHNFAKTLYASSKFLLLRSSSSDSNRSSCNASNIFLNASFSSFLVALYSAIAFSIGISDVKEIDSINILNASFQAMHRAIDGIHTKIDILLIDGNSFIPYSNTPHKCIIRGDNKFFSIAAASVLSKVHRDYLMKELHNKFPMYNWQKNKGYPTREHRLAIKKHGISNYHRKSFQLLPT